MTVLPEVVTYTDLPHCENEDLPSREEPHEGLAIFQRVVRVRRTMGNRLGESKVNDFDRRIIKCTEKIFRLDVAMQDSERVYIL